jgi:transposase InsO family protein
MLEFILKPWHLVVLFLAAQISREQQRAIEYLHVENQVLREKLGKRRLLLNDDQRRRLAVKGKALGLKALRELAAIVTPDTILRWHRELVAKKWDFSNLKKPVGRPGVCEEVVRLVVQMAKENPTWGYDRIQGALKNLGFHIADSSVGNILKEHGIEPAPDRKRQTTWKTFLSAHWDVLAAVDFTTIEVWTRGGLVTFYILVVMRLSTRRIEIAGVTPNPDGAWVQQAGRNLTDCYDGFLRDTKYLLLDRDTKFLPLRAVLKSTDTKEVLLPPKSPNLNAHIERYMRSMKSECLERMVFFGENSLRQALAQFVEHYHAERNHQGLGNRLIEPSAEVGSVEGEVTCRNRLGGLLRYYYREAA